MPTEARFHADGKLLLDYLFVAEYQDGTIYEQGPADESLFGGINAYTDIFYRAFKPLEELVCFKLLGSGNCFTVDLRDGHFEVNGVRFEAVADEKPLPPGGTFTLVYWRGHQHEATRCGAEVIEKHFVHYRIGWKYHLGPREWIQTISVE